MNARRVIEDSRKLLLRKLTVLKFSESRHLEYIFQQGYIIDLATRRKHLIYDERFSVWRLQIIHRYHIQCCDNQRITN